MGWVVGFGGSECVFFESKYTLKQILWLWKLLYGLLLGIKSSALMKLKLLKSKTPNMGCT